MNNASATLLEFQKIFLQYFYPKTIFQVQMNEGIQSKYKSLLIHPKTYIPQSQTLLLLYHEIKRFHFLLVLEANFQSHVSLLHMYAIHQYVKYQLSYLQNQRRPRRKFF